MLIFIAVALIYGFITYSIFKVDSSGLIYDGLGRQLYEAPLWAKFLLLNEHRWPGLFWTIFDRAACVCFGSLAYIMHKLATKMSIE